MSGKLSIAARGSERFVNGSSSGAFVSSGELVFLGFSGVVGFRGLVSRVFGG